MSLRMIARDLYRLQQEVDRLQGLLKTCSPVKRGDMEDELRKATAERDRVRRMLEGTKEEPAYRKAK